MRLTSTTAGLLLCVPFLLMAACAGDHQPEGSTDDDSNVGDSSANGDDGDIAGGDADGDNGGSDVGDKGSDGDVGDGDNPTDGDKAGDQGSDGDSDPADGNADGGGDGGDQGGDSGADAGGDSGGDSGGDADDGSDIGKDGIARSRITKIMRSDGDYIDYTYSGNKLASMVVYKGGTAETTATFEYKGDFVSSMKITSPSYNDTMTLGYDSKERLSTIKVTYQNMPVTITNTYGGNTYLIKQSASVIIGSYVSDYTYEGDKLKKILAVVTMTGTSTTINDETWTYDSNGVLTSVHSIKKDPQNPNNPATESLVSFVFDASRVSQVTDGTAVTTVEYDDHGRVKRTVETKDGATVTSDYSYDPGAVVGVVPAATFPRGALFDLHGKLLPHTDMYLTVPPSAEQTGPLAPLSLRALFY